jgi:cyclopropane-fatty-acyl-phospholipid synthase
MSADSLAPEIPSDRWISLDNAPWGIEPRDAAVIRRVRREGIVGLGETYLQGLWTANRLDDVIYAVFTSPMPRLSATIRAKWLLALADQRLFNRQSGRRAFNIGIKHYDLGNDLFRCMLDESMTYTCGYWDQAATLHEAQLAKLDLVCRKLDLRPGLRVLDIGCGWGNFAQHAAERYGVSVIGITVSQQQAELARHRCRGLPVEIRLQDYRGLTETFDRIASIEMIEAVGRKNIPTFFGVVNRCLKDDGLFVLQAISGNTLSRSSDRRLDQYALWLLKYIFPDGYLPKQMELIAPENTSLRIEDWQSFGPDYDRTLLAWANNFNTRWDQLSGHYDEAFRRRWNFYLHGCAAAFRARLFHLYQIVYAKGGCRPRSSARPDLHVNVIPDAMNDHG